ncbi:MAG: hypothetical protein KJP03_06775, partial [Gammaproteobacteria bacterium]|nr:hypothetical protein [Gammaproteobacteria bacterium]
MSQTDADNATTLLDSELPYRMLAENFLSPQESAQLLEFADEHSIVGDGYHGNPHPHTPHETFAGYSLDGRQGNTTVAGHLLTLEVMNRARLMVKKHFRLPFLWLEYGHLVVREATGAGAEAEAEEYSHPWHYDNQAGSIKYRSHTAILYLNDGFEGGLTRFKETDFGPFREFTPEAGKLVAF